MTNAIRVIKVIIHDPDLDEDDIDRLMEDMFDACTDALHYGPYRHRDVELVEDDE